MNNNQKKIINFRRIDNCMNYIKSELEKIVTKEDYDNLIPYINDLEINLQSYTYYKNLNDERNQPKIKYTFTAIACLIEIIGLLLIKYGLDVKPLLGKIIITAYGIDVSLSAFYSIHVYNKASDIEEQEMAHNLNLYQEDIKTSYKKLIEQCHKLELTK